MNTVVLKACLKTALKDVSQARENPCKGQALARAHTLLNEVLRIVESEEPHASQRRPKQRIQVQIGEPLHRDTPLQQMMFQTGKQAQVLPKIIVVENQSYHFVDVVSQDLDGILIVYAVYEEC